MISISFQATTIDLPADLLWDDEFSWRPVEQRVEPTITGALIVQSATRLAGRPVTLRSGPDFAWLTRAKLETLLAWADAPGRVMSLTIRGTARDVIFRHQDGRPIEAEMILYHASPTADDFYVATIRLQQV